MMNLLFRLGKGAIVLGLAVGLSLVLWALTYPAHHAEAQRLMKLGTLLTLMSWVSLLGWFLFVRGHTLLDVYRSGYRTGRRDANAQLLEEGLLLVTKAEQDAADLYEDDTKGNS
jgi:hypothetical protein